MKKHSLNDHGFKEKAEHDINEITFEETEFSMLLESAPDAMVVVDQFGIIQMVNTQTERVFGYQKGELIGQKVETLMPERFHKIHPNHLGKFVKNPVIRYMGSGLELWGQRKNHEEFPVEISLSPLNTQKGFLVISAIRDITERKKLENKLAAAQKGLEKKVEERTRELKAKNRELRQFAYVASHDLQEPLRKVRNFTELLKNEYITQLDEKAQEYMNYIVDGATRMQYLIRGLLSYSRVGSGELKMSKTNLKKVVEEITEDLEIRIKESQAEITCNSLPELEVEPVLIKQLLQNLIDNGLKYRSEKTPQIVVSAAQKNNFWQISVSDNGVGIDPDFFERVFIIFKRLHTHEEYPGTGIGLAICKKIVKLHGGKIWLESEPDKGTTVYFTVASDLKNRRNTKYSEGS